MCFDRSKWREYLKVKKFGTQKSKEGTNGVAMQHQLFQEESLSEKWDCQKGDVDGTNGWPCYHWFKTPGEVVRVGMDITKELSCGVLWSGRPLKV